MENLAQSLSIDVARLGEELQTIIALRKEIEAERDNLDHKALHKRRMLLKEAKDIYEYMEILSEMRRDVVILIAAKDTTGAPMGLPLASALFELGLRINLRDKFRQSYLAIIEKGLIIHEAISKYQEEIFFEGIISNVPIYMASAGFSSGKKAVIKLNGFDYSVNMRGLNFVILGKEAQILDCVGFDTYLENAPFGRVGA